MLHRFAPSFVAAAILLTPLIAFAEEEDEAYEEMVDLSNEAANAVADGHYEIGAVKFRQAYDIYPDPILLNNEMIAWYRADDCRNALPPARAFLETEGLQPEDREDVEAVQLQCHLTLAEEAIQEQNAVLASYHLDSLIPLDLDDEEEHEYLALRQRIDDELEPVPDDEVAPVAATAPGPAVTRTWLPISGGIAATGIGLALHAVALSRQSELQALADSNDPADAQRLNHLQQQWGSSQSTARWAVPSLYAIGGLAIGSGVFFLLRDDTDDSAEYVSVAPAVDTDHLGLSLSGQF